MRDQKQKRYIANPMKLVVIHPIIGDYLKSMQKVLGENGNVANYSVAINAVLLMAVMESKRPEGFSKETIEAVKDFIRDESTIRELETIESELLSSLKPEKKTCYIS